MLRQFLGAHIPQLHHGVGAAGRHARAVGVEGHGVDGGEVVVVHVDARVLVHVPQAHRRVACMCVGGTRRANSQRRRVSAGESAKESQRRRVSAGPFPLTVLSSDADTAHLASAENCAHLTQFMCPVIVCRNRAPPVRAWTLGWRV